MLQILREVSFCKYHAMQVADLLLERHNTMKYFSTLCTTVSAFYDQSRQLRRRQQT